MMGFLIRALITAAGLWLASEIVPGVGFTSWTSLAAAAVLLGVVNALIRPVILLLTLPFTVLTLGLFVLVVNGAMVGLVARLLKGFYVHGLGPAVMSAIVVGVTSWIASWFIREPTVQQPNG